MRVNVTEKCFYVILIPTLIFLAIFLPIIINYAFDGLARNKLPPTPPLSEIEYKYITLAKLDDYLTKFLKGREIWVTKKDIGLSQAKNPIHLITMKEKSVKRPKVVIVSGISASDWSSVIINLKMMRSFIANRKRIRQLLRFWEINFIPLLNPDGYEYSQCLPVNQLWKENYKKSGAKIQGLSVLTNAFDEENIALEASLFQKYFLSDKENIKAAFFLFTPPNIKYTEGIFTLKTAFEDAEKMAFLEDLAVSIIAERGGFFTYKKNELSTEDRLDEWVLNKSSNEFIVGSFMARYLPNPLEILKIHTKQLAGDIYFILSRMLEIVESTKASLNS